MSTTNSLESNKIKYLDLTHKLNDYNEIYSVNSYLKEANTDELYRLKTTNEALKSKVLTLKQNYMMKSHDIAEYKFRINIMYFTAIIIALVIIFVALYSMESISKRLAIILSSTVGVIYLIFLLFIVRLNSERRKYAYDQFYWNPIKQSR